MKVQHIVINPRLLKNRLRGLHPQVAKQMVLRNQGKKYWVQSLPLIITLLVCVCMGLQFISRGQWIYSTPVFAVLIAWNVALGYAKRSYDREWIMILQDFALFCKKFNLSANAPYSVMLEVGKERIQQDIDDVMKFARLRASAAGEEAISFAIHNENAVREWLGTDFDLAEKFLGNDLDDGLKYRAFKWSPV